MSTHYKWWLQFKIHEYLKTCNKNTGIKFYGPYTWHLMRTSTWTVWLFDRVKYCYLPLGPFSIKMRRWKTIFAIYIINIQHIFHDVKVPNSDKKRYICFINHLLLISSPSVYTYSLSSLSVSWAPFNVFSVTSSFYWIFTFISTYSFTTSKYIQTKKDDMHSIKTKRLTIKCTQSTHHLHVAIKTIEPNHM